MVEPICRVAIIGAGYTAREHARAFAAVPCVRLAGNHSRTRARAEALAREFHCAGVYDTIAALYAGTQADLVVVTVNELSMRAVATACFAYPWTVLLEKPAGLTVPEAELIDAAGRAAGRDVRVALNRQSLSVTRTVRQALTEHDGPRFIKVQDQENPVAAAAAGQPPEVVANWMYANSIHLVDYFRLFARGRAVAVDRVVPWNAERPGVVVAKIEFDSGDIGLYEAIWHAPGPWAVSVTVPGHRWELRPLEQGLTQTLGQQLEPLPVHPWDTEFKPGFRHQAEQAVAAALGQPSDLATTADALATMRLIRAIY